MENLVHWRLTADEFWPSRSGDVGMWNLAENSKASIILIQQCSSCFSLDVSKLDNVCVLIIAQAFNSDMDGGVPHNLYCPHCHNNSVQPIKHKRFVTVFFVPIVPIRWCKQLKCQICNYTRDVSRKALSEMKQWPIYGSATDGMVSG